VTFRGSYDQFSYDGDYPFDSGIGDVLGAGRPQQRARLALERRRAADPSAAGPPGGDARAEFIDNIHRTSRCTISTRFGAVRFHRSSIRTRLRQDEIKLAPWLIANGGLRYDRYDDFTRVTPRAALIATPSPSLSFKSLRRRVPCAELVRAERVLLRRSHELAAPETIDTHEVVWERYTNDWLRTSVSTYWYKADGLITLAPDRRGAPRHDVRQRRPRRARTASSSKRRCGLTAGLQGLMSYALQRAEDLDTGLGLVNSPAQMGKIRVSIPGR
jgi:outer membrane receptor protein involved in Fe transport